MYTFAGSLLYAEKPYTTSNIVRHNIIIKCHGRVGRCMDIILGVLLFLLGCTMPSNFGITVVARLRLIDTMSLFGRATLQGGDVG